MAQFCKQNLARSIASFPSSDVRQAIVGAFHRVDSLGRNSDHQDSGSTAIVCCINSEAISVGNAGDCRAVLCRSGKAVNMSSDHRPNLEHERERIEAAGGWVEEASSTDADARVNGDLAISRALGDYHLKQDADRPAEMQIVIPTPDVEVFQRSRKDEFMVIASDGIWEVLSSQAVVDWIRPKLGRTSDMEQRLNDGTLDLSELAERLVDHCLAPRPGLLVGIGEDNMTVIIIVFVKSFWAGKRLSSSEDSLNSI